jgi:hypothetical protein
MRFGIWCLDDCSKDEIAAKTCEIRTIGLRIAKKTIVNGKEKWTSKFREWSRSEANKNFVETCPSPYDYYRLLIFNFNFNFSKKSVMLIKQLTVTSDQRRLFV